MAKYRIKDHNSRDIAAALYQSSYGIGIYLDCPIFLLNKGRIKRCWYDERWQSVADDSSTMVKIGSSLSHKIQFEP